MPTTRSRSALERNKNEFALSVLKHPSSGRGDILILRRQLYNAELSILNQPQNQRVKNDVLRMVNDAINQFPPRLRAQIDERVATIGSSRLHAPRRRAMSVVNRRANQVPQPAPQDGQRMANQRRHETQAIRAAMRPSQRQQNEIATLRVRAVMQLLDGNTIQGGHSPYLGALFDARESVLRQPQNQNVYEQISTARHNIIANYPNASRVIDSLSTDMLYRQAVRDPIAFVHNHRR